MAPRQTPREKLQDVVRALKDAGWSQTGRGRFCPPFSLMALTPGNIPAHWWQNKVYPRYRFLNIAATERPVYWAERQNAPWVAPSSSKIPVARVAEFLAEVTADAQCGFLADGPRQVPVMVPPTDKWGNLL
jgi:hypothetical protein